jgi:hypothetical protein
MVYKVEGVKFHRFVVLKFLPDGIATDAEALARFRREARTAVLSHPNIAIAPLHRKFPK